MRSDVLSKLVKDSLAGKKQPFCKELREFAVTLQFYSPRAYLYVRKEFGNILPHPRTLRRWYTVVDGKPGFTSEAFETIKLKATNKSLFCNLVVDEMCVKRQIEIDPQQNIYGHINMGTGAIYDADDIPIAKNALVFMLVGMNDYWKLPIGYFLIDGLTGAERSNLLSKAIELITDTGAHLCSITFDGATVNTSMCTVLGANFNDDSPFILNPATNEKIFTFYDAAHMIKLVRNAFGDKKIIIDGNGDLIKWDYIVKLYEKEKLEGLRAATKLTARHIFYHNEKMNVRLAAQVLSDSVGDALTYLSNEDPEFKGCGPTAQFCKMMNNAFDILNSRRLYSKNPYNNAITKNTFTKYQEFMNLFSEYLQQLKFLDGTLIITSKRKTGFRGLLMGLYSSLELFELLQAKGHMNFLITYKLSQDHLETFFSAIRGKGGYNNNPTSRQFQAAYKRLLVHNAIIGSEHGNCAILDRTKILTTTGIIQQTIAIENGSNDHDYYQRLIKLNSYIEDISIYIAGFVVMKMYRLVECDTCKKHLITNTQASKLGQIKDRGALMKPSLDVQTICIETEKVFRGYINEIMNERKACNFIVMKVKRNLYQKYSVFDNMSCVNNNLINVFDLNDNFNTHRDQLIKKICEIYYKTRFCHEAKKANDKLTLRTKFTKLIHFRHE